MPAKKSPSKPKRPAKKKAGGGCPGATCSAVVDFRSVEDHSCWNCRFFSRKTARCKFPGIRWDLGQLPHAPKRFVCDSWKWKIGTHKSASIREMCERIDKQNKRAAQAAGIPDKVTPHCLRHSFCSDLLDAGHSPRRVQEAMGHSDIRTTMGYARKECLDLPSPLETLTRRAS